MRSSWHRTCAAPADEDARIAAVTGERSPSMAGPDWVTADSFVVGGVEYVCRPLNERFPSTADRMCLVKWPWQVAWYQRLLQEVAPQRVVELGMWDGASVSLCAE